jgi:hypothetical protein
LVLDRSAVIKGCGKRSIAWHITRQKDLENVWIFMRNRRRKGKKSDSSSFLKITTVLVPCRNGTLNSVPGHDSAKEFGSSSKNETQFQSSLGHLDWNCYSPWF